VLRLLQYLTQVFLVFSLLGCAALPASELVNYIEISDEAETSGAAIYGALNTVILWDQNKAKVAERQKCAPSESTPTCFDPSFFLDAPAITDPSVEARLLALETVAAYNDTLVALNAGESAIALNKRVTKLGGLALSLSQVAPISGGRLSSLLAEPVIASLAGFAAKLEGLRARAVVRKSVLEESDTIKAIIALLIEDTSAVYDLYFLTQSKYARSLPGGRRSPEAKAEYAKIKIMHNSLGAFVTVLGQTRQSLDVLSTAIVTQNSDPATLQAAIEQTLDLKLAARSLRDTVRGLEN
jgi:hypothetical protein